MKWIKRGEIAIGIWLIVSPWILGFDEFTPALWNSIILGAAVAVLGIWRVFGKKLDKKIK